MVIISPILERDHEFSEVIWNTAGRIYDSFIDLSQI